MKMFGELRLVRALTDGQIVAMRDPRLAGTVKLPTIEDAVKAEGFLAGRPADIIEQLKAVEERYPGLDRVICATPLRTPLDVQLEDLDRFAKEVVPAFRDVTAPARAAAEQLRPETSHPAQAGSRRAVAALALDSRFRVCEEIGRGTSKRCIAVLRTSRRARGRSSA
jgi:hypothetical protein